MPDLCNSQDLQYTKYFIHTEYSKIYAFIYLFDSEKYQEGAKVEIKLRLETPIKGNF